MVSHVINIAIRQTKILCESVLRLLHFLCTEPHREHLTATHPPLQEITMSSGRRGPQGPEIGCPKAQKRPGDQQQRAENQPYNEISLTLNCNCPKPTPAALIHHVDNVTCLIINILHNDGECSSNSYTRGSTRHQGP